MRVPLKHPSMIVLAAAMLAVPVCLAKKATIRMSWDKARTTHESGDFRSRVRVFLKTSQHLQGTLAGMTASGLRLQRQGSETLIPRNEIHSIRFVSRQMSGWNNRLIALAGGVPAGLFAGYGVAALSSNTCCEFGKLGPTELILYGTWAGVQYVLYKIGARADRGVLHVVLYEIGTDTSEPDQNPSNPLQPKESLP